MNLRFPLSLKVSIWLVLNLALLSALGIFFFFGKMGSEWASLISGPAIDRVRAISDYIQRDLQENPDKDRDAILANFSDAYGVEFLLLGLDGTRIAGPEIVIPPEVLERIKVLRAPPMRGGGRGGFSPLGRGGRSGQSSQVEFNPGGRRGGFPPSQDTAGSSPGSVASPAPGRGGERPASIPATPVQPGAPQPAAAQPSVGFVVARGGPPPGGGPENGFMHRTVDPTLYWIGRRFPLPTSTGVIPSALVAVTGSVGSAGLFFDFKPFVYAGIAVAGLSILFWLPVVGGVTGSLRRLSRATEKIAEGRFETRVQIDRTDELGSLGESVNRMAGRLDSMVTGQRRFLGDIAHELGSPLARMQFATSILEERAGAELKDSVTDVKEEVEKMSELVNELLAFTRAGLKPREAAIADVDLAPLVKGAVEREDAIDRVAIRIPEGLKVRCDSALLARALNNLVRNAVRYGGGDGPITVEAQQAGDRVRITVADLGPGVPPESLARLGEPFFRPETARTRETGGVGLGLAIVKSAVQACEGTITFSNRTPKGFAAEISLRAAGGSTPAAA